MKAAFYKGTRPGLQGIYSRAVRWIDRGAYSHCELVFSDGLSASASYIDGGVRFKAIDYSLHPEHWDFLDLPDELEDYARGWFERNAGAPYDLMGNVRFVLPIVPASSFGWFCSEAMAAALRLQEPWRFGPNGLAALLPTIFCGGAYGNTKIHRRLTPREDARREIRQHHQPRPHPHFPWVPGHHHGHLVNP